MRTATGALLVVVGVLLLWLAATGRLSRLADAWAALKGSASPSATTNTAQSGGSSSVPGMPTAFPTLPGFPGLPSLPSLPPILTEVAS